MGFWDTHPTGTSLIDVLTLGMAIFGLTAVIVEGAVGKLVRSSLAGPRAFFGRLLSCYQCTGFYVGLIAAGMAVDPIQRPDAVLVIAFAASGLSYLLGAWVSSLVPPPDASGFPDGHDGDRDGDRDETDTGHAD